MEVFVNEDLITFGNQNINNQPIKSDSPKNKGGRPSKTIKYVEERNLVLQKLYEIIGVNEKNKIFYFEDLNEEKQKKIMNLTTDCKKYFNTGHWNAFLKKTSSEPHVSLIRSILKDMEIKSSTAYVYDEKDRKNIQKRGIRILN
jgi:hypothetical protein